MPSTLTSTPEQLLRCVTTFPGRRLDADASSVFDAGLPSATAFAAHADRAGLPARLVRLVGFRGPAPDADPRWERVPPAGWHHHVAVAAAALPARDHGWLDGSHPVWAVDFTARQFLPWVANPVLEPVSALLADWAEGHLLSR